MFHLSIIYSLSNKFLTTIVSQISGIKKTWRFRISWEFQGGCDFFWGEGGGQGVAGLRCPSSPQSISVTILRKKVKNLWGISPPLHPTGLQEESKDTPPPRQLPLTRLIKIKKNPDYWENFPKFLAHVSSTELSSWLTATVAMAISIQEITPICPCSRGRQDVLALGQTDIYIIPGISTHHH